MIVVEQPGLRTTVQDRGRVGLAHLGVPRSGAVDWYSAALANAIVGNETDAALLETTLTGPTLRFETAAVVAVAGAVTPAPGGVGLMTVACLLQNTVTAAKRIAGVS